MFSNILPSTLVTETTQSNIRMTSTITPSPLSDLIAQARAVQSKLDKLWADEGVDQLQIFLDPGTAAVLAEIKQLSMSFIQHVARLDS